MKTERDFMWGYRVKDRQAESRTKGQDFTYGRRFAELVAFPQNNELTWYQQRLELIQQHVYLPLRSTILIVGAGYGFLHEVMLDAGYSNITSIDDNAHIYKTLSANATPQVRKSFKQVNILDDVSGLGTFDIVITEDMASSIDWRDYETFFSNLDTIAPIIVHLITTDVPYPYQRSTLKSWHRRYARHIWIDLVNGEKI